MAEVRRKSKRLRTGLQTALRVDYKPDDQTASGQADSSNISKRGICLLLPERQPHGKGMALKIHLPSGNISARGKVVWTQSHFTIWGAIFPTGVRFDKISSADAVKIEHFISLK